MSYLDIPRIHIAGQFFTDPSTINNDFTAYHPQNTRPYPSWCPNGCHVFKLKNCQVRSAMTSSGPTNDPVVGAEVKTTDRPSGAKLVDLDVDQQMVSTVYGLELCLTLDDGSRLVGTMDPAALNGIWMSRALSFRGREYQGYDNDFGSGSFQSVIRVKPANWSATSGVLEQLKATAVRDEKGHIVLSFKFVLDAYTNDQRNPYFNFGRFIGTLGPAKENEPLHTLAHRWLMPRSLPQAAAWYVPAFYGAPFKVDYERQKLIIDWSNSLSMKTVGGRPVDLQSLNAVIGYEPEILVGAVDYSQFAYDNNAGITELDLTFEQLNLLNHRGLKLVTTRNDIGDPVVFKESESGLALAVDARVFRMTPDRGKGRPFNPKNTPNGGTWTNVIQTEVYITQWGQPLPNKQLSVHVQELVSETEKKARHRTTPKPVTHGGFQFVITPSNHHGVATITLWNAQDPGNRTLELDGRVYSISVFDGNTPPVTFPQEHQFFVRICSHYEIQIEPAWQEIQAIMAPYMKLYPCMKEMIDLPNYETFEFYATNPPYLDGSAIAFFLKQAFTDPRYMPVSRDLSPNKVQTILNYIQRLPKNNLVQNTLEDPPIPPEEQLII